MKKHKNLVFVFSDQQRYDSMACYGNGWIKTPNLNALSEESFIFERAYVSQPVCTPARATILTGLYPHTAGPTMNTMPLPPDTKTLAEYLPDGYTTAYFGKWHLGDDNNAQHGFQHWISTQDHAGGFVGLEGEPKKSDYHNYLEERGYEPDETVSPDLSYVPSGAIRNVPDNWRTFSSSMRTEVEAEDTMAHFLGREAAEFINDHGDEPFVLYVSTVEPHSPYNSPYNDLYDPAFLPTGPSFLKVPEGGALVNRLIAENNMQFLEGSSETYMGNVERVAMFNDISSEYGWKRLRARYFAAITLIDDMVGMITDALKEQGIFDDTVVVFTSEHGDMTGDHGMLHKMSMYEESARVPLVIRAPGVSNQKSVIGGNFGHVDLVPTLLDLMGCDVPDKLDGKSVVNMCWKRAGNLRNNEVYVQWNGIGWIDTGPAEDGSEGVIIQTAIGTPEIQIMHQAPWRTIVVNDWKLNLCASDQCELYNLLEDPHEMNNLYDHPDYQDVVRLLSTKIRAWQFRTRDDAVI